jgi:hypothetical protein
MGKAESQIDDFEQIYHQILKAYVNIWSKNLVINMSKMAILVTIQVWPWLYRKPFFARL